MQAAILSVKLNHIEEWTNKRIECANYYLKNLKDIDEVILPVKADWARQVYHLFVVRVKNRDKLKNFLKSKGIDTGIHYPISLPMLKAYSHMNYQEDEFEANRMSDELLSLPDGHFAKLVQLQTEINKLRSEQEAWRE